MDVRAAQFVLLFTDDHFMSVFFFTNDDHSRIACELCCLDIHAAHDVVASKYFSTLDEPGTGLVTH